MFRENDLRQRKYRKVKSNEGTSAAEFSRKNVTGSVPELVGYGLIIVFLLLIKFFYVFENSLPDQVKIKNANMHPGRFIGEKAELQLKRLTELGTRVVGSYENEVLAVDFLKREISFISQEANHIHKIEVDVQKPTGSYFLSFKPHGFRNYYTNIQNVVVKLSSGETENSILMNCHYDTVPESPGVKESEIIKGKTTIDFTDSLYHILGASDNGVNCVVMLEILRVLATSTEPLKNNVIFLFNGAEENPLQASHGFLSQHKWRNEVKVVINLDSAGAGGREILFQTSGEPWLVEAYARVVPRPTAGVQAEELFHYGIIPSDTDFRVFRDFGGYPGFDIAHCTNGYIYHTKFDTIDFVHPGVYQNTGDNMLALVKELLNSRELDQTHSKTRMVYFDVFTLFMIVYTEKFGIILNLLTVVLSFAAIYKTFRNLQGGSFSVLLAVGGQIHGFLLAGGFVFFISKTLDFFESTMSWYLRPWLILLLYCFPTVFILASVLTFTQKFMGKELISYSIIRFTNGAQILWTFILLVGTLKGIRTSFIPMLNVLFPSIGSLLVGFYKPFSAKAYLIVYYCCLVFPILFTVSQAVRIFTVIIPMTARMGPHVNPEIIIGALAFLISAICLSQMVPSLLFLRKLKRFLISLCVLHIITMSLVSLTEFGFPYDGNISNPALQRFYVMHCDRTFHDAKGSIRRVDSGFFIQSLDRNNVNYVSNFLPELRTAREAAEDCSNEVFCGFPVFTSRFIRPAPYSYWIPGAPPVIHHPTSLEIVNQTQVLVNVRRIRMLITGPDHITLALSPRNGVELIKWSFDSSTPQDIESWKERKTYMVYYSHGLMGGSLEFDIDLEIGQNHTDHVMNIAVIGHYMHDKKFQTKELKKILSKFPSWTHLTSWTTTYKSWVIS